MEALIKVFERLENSVERRIWLLYEALRFVPLDEAVELAREADAFIMGTAEKGEQARREVAPKADEQPIGDQAQNEPQRKERSSPKGRLSLSAEQRDRMLDRLAAGTKNADIAEEFDLSPQAGSGRPYRVGPRNCRSLPGEA
jgi:DNA-binding NarL/FixJ family response regulator